jgi:hypothetical protein
MKRFRYRVRVLRDGHIALPVRCFYTDDLLAAVDYQWRHSWLKSLHDCHIEIWDMEEDKEI